MHAKLTAQFCKTIKAPEKGQRDYWDLIRPGLGLRVSQGGKRAWTVVYKKNGRMRRFTLGSFPTLPLADARRAAAKALLAVQNGKDPATAKREARVAETFGELSALYLERHAKVEKRSWPEDERIIDRELLPAWKFRKAGETRRADVIALLDGIVERGAPVMANRTRALISKIFNFGIGREIVEANPAHGIGRPGGAEQQRDRVLSEEEIRTVWKALESESPKTRAIFRLALLTAQRRSEITGMQWAELDLDSGWWTIPAERAKNGLAHRVPLSPEAVRILESVKRSIKRKKKTGARDEPLVFRGGRIGRPLTNLQKPMRRIKDASAVDFHFHDLRRTAASLMTGIGIPRLVVSKILNHIEGGITAVYDRHSYDAEKRAALLKWERHLVAIATGNKAPVKVIAFR
ncbi:MAG: tyrosine-type recombinase/integrase [Beijerinckiaceae bacterium]|jgi:integrase